MAKLNLVAEGHPPCQPSLRVVDAGLFASLKEDHRIPADFRSLAQNLVGKSCGDAT